MAERIHAGYANVMSIRRITISVPASVASRIKKAAGRIPVSAWVTAVIEEHLEDADLELLWEEFYRAVRPRLAQVRRANEIFRRLTSGPTNRRIGPAPRGRGAAQSGRF